MNVNLYDNEKAIVAADRGHSDNLEQYMVASSIPFEKCVGGYTMAYGEVVEEPSFLIDMKNFLRIVTSGFCRYQESFLVLKEQDHHGHRYAELVYTRNMAQEIIGKYQHVSEEVARASVGWTRTADGRYFTAR